MNLDLFAGPGGWDEGARQLGMVTVGLETDHAACHTAVTAGYPRIRADVAAYPTEPFAGKVAGLIASPPCQAWSMAGKRAGEADRAHCHQLADRMGRGDDSLDWTVWEDARSPLVCQPVRWVRELRPEWVALEEVPAVESLWRHFAVILSGWGYRTWVGILNAADYGVPQTRRRCILMASRVRPVAPPVPTHSPDGCDGDLFGDGRERWVSMAQALGWDTGDRLRHPRGEGLTERHGERRDFNGDEPAMTVTGKARSWEHYVVDRRTNSRAACGTSAPTVPVPVTEPAPTFTGKSGTRWVVRPDETPPVYGNGNQPNAGRRSADEPAPTVLFGNRSNDVRWVHERPATTVVGSYNPDVIAAPGYRTQVSRQNAEGSVRVTVAEAGILQSFPPDYPWQGSRTKQFQQVGNAIPPRLAAHILAVLTGAEVPA